MATAQRLDTALGLYFKKQLRDVHTSVPARVNSVDYGAGTMELLPTVQTIMENGSIDGFSSILDVPILVLSGNGGKAKLTFPITAGDDAAVVFSERNPSNSSDQSTHGLFPSFGTTVGGEIDPVDVVLKNDISVITLQPDGTINITSGSATIDVEPSGSIMMNGATITSDGNFISKDGVNLRDFYQDYITHYHGNVSSGNSNTSTKRN